MKQIKAWLDKSPGMATSLRQELGVNATSISNVKHGRRPLPTRWMPVIEKLSGGKIKLSAMVKYRNTRAKEAVSSA